MLLIIGFRTKVSDCIDGLRHALYDEIDYGDGRKNIVMMIMVIMVMIIIMIIIMSMMMIIVHTRLDVIDVMHVTIIKPRSITDINLGVDLYIRQ